VQLRDLHNLADIILHILSNGQHDVKDVDVVPETFNDRILDRRYISSLQLQGTNEEALDLFEKLGILIGSQKSRITSSKNLKMHPHFLSSHDRLGFHLKEGKPTQQLLWFLVPCGTGKGTVLEAVGYTVPVPTTGPPMYDDGDLISLIRLARNALNHTEGNKTKKNSQKRKVLLQELGKDENELEHNLHTKFPLLLTRVYNVVANYRIDKAYDKMEIRHGERVFALNLYCSFEDCGVSKVFSNVLQFFITTFHLTEFDMLVNQLDSLSSKDKILD
ncbi:zinc finger, CCHC-type containing protein, partial [Tanacetum coccineum]